MIIRTTRSNRKSTVIYRLKAALLLSLLSFAGMASAGCLWWQECAEYKTKYPIMLVHGFAGAANLAGVDYFYDIPRSLEERGARVFVASVSAANTPEYRGEQLIQQIETALAISGDTKVNLIGHSLGSPTSRYVAAVRPDLVASVTSVSGVNFGSASPWFLENVVIKDPLISPVVEGIINDFFQLVGLFGGAPAINEADIIKTLQAMTPQEMARFNSQYPEGKPASYCGDGPEVGSNGVYYYSWGGDEMATNVLDASDLFLHTVGALAFPATRNDGLVATCDMHWGKVLGMHFNMNHLDTINQLFGIDSPFEVSPVSLYKLQAVRLKSKNL